MFYFISESVQDFVHTMQLLLFSRDVKDLKGKQAKQSMEAVKMVSNDKGIKNRPERDRYAHKWK